MFPKKQFFTFAIILLIQCVWGSLIYAVEVAPRISDREIIESLAELKAGQKSMEKSMDQRFAQIQKTIDQRFEQIDKRLAYQENLTMILIASILGLVAFVIWDRKTALRPLEKKLDKLEQDLQRDMELQNPEGSKLTRLIHVLREMAQNDPKISEALRAFSLL